MERRSWVSYRGAERLLMVALGTWVAVMLASFIAPPAAAEFVHGLADVRITASRLILSESCLGLGVTIVVVVARLARGRTMIALGSSEHWLQVAQAAVDAHGNDSLAPFIVRPDKSFEIVHDTVIAYRQVGSTVVVSGDPVGPADQHQEAFRRLRTRTAAAGLGLVVYGAGTADLDLYRRTGMRVLCVGEEAVVDPMTFSLEGRAIRKVRQSVHRVSKRGWSVSAVEGRQIDRALLAEIEAVERKWRAAHDRVLGFAMSLGTHEHGARPDDLVILARTPQGELRAVMRFLAHRGNLSLDTMRRTGETPNGLNEALICCALAVAREHCVAEVSLNYAGLAHLLHRGDQGGWLRRAGRRLTLRLLGRAFQLERLVCFNEKFSPTWRPRYLIYESRLAFIGSVIRVLQAEGYVATRLLRSESDAAAIRPQLIDTSAGLGARR